MSKRINIVLPDATIAVLDRVAPKGNRSKFISQAVVHYVESVGKENLKERLKAGYQANAAESLRIAMEWFPLEEEASLPRVTPPRRGDIYVVSFDPTLGHEIRKTRPALVIQNDVGNRYSGLTIVAAITSKIKFIANPVNVIVEPSARNGLVLPSAILLDQIRTIDKQRLVKRLGRLESSLLEGVDEAIQISLGLVKI